jgi:hypothetical protein
MATDIIHIPKILPEITIVSEVQSFPNGNMVLNLFSFANCWVFANKFWVLFVSLFFCFAAK